MYFFTLASVDRFAEAISVLNRLTKSGVLVVSSDMASITIDHHSLDFVVCFQMMPPFFTRFFSSHTHHSRISLQPFNDLLSTTMQPSLFTSLALYVNDDLPDGIRLQFRNPCPKDHENAFFNRQLTMENMPIKSPFSRIDMATFVSIRSQDFERVITMFNGDEDILVSLTNSSVTFSERSKKITFTKTKRNCIIIGGTIKGEIDFRVTINPLYLYQNITLRSERVWFFKNSNDNTMMIAPTGLFDQYMMLFPFES